MAKVKHPVLLMILDGWGEGRPGAGNAIDQARIPNYHTLAQEYPRTTLEASGEAVGLPAGVMGNSEVGHLNIGAGRIVYQELTRINKAVRDNSFYANPVLNQVMDTARENGTALHLMGLLSDGGVHSHIDHLYALLALAKQKGLTKVFVHAFLDGRDVPPANAGEYITALEAKMQTLGLGQIATVMGRYYAMDRDKRWERVEKAYRALVVGEGNKSPLPLAAVQQSYEDRVTDEFVVPTVIVTPQGQPRAVIGEGDAVIFYNFRSDRAREITRAFVEGDFNGFTRPAKHPRVDFACLTQYDITIRAPVAYPPQNLANTLGQVLAAAGLQQLRIAETEKYAHVTFFFNGGVEEPNPGEERILIPSPQVATYNLKPDMSAYEVTTALEEKIRSGQFDFIVLNYANSDMVGHTGIIEAAVAAVEAVDNCLGRIITAARATGMTVLITADHGNAEQMVDPRSGQPQTAHTTNKVPFILVDDRFKDRQLREGLLEDIAPTVLQLLGQTPPPEMTGKSLIVE